jgi:hypothetical protein
VIKRTAKKFIAAFIILISTASVFAQHDKNGGSLYSIFGIGDLNYSSSIRTDAMGIMGLSLMGNYTNTLNPAAWTQMQSTRFSTRFRLENFKSTDGTNTAKRTYGDFDGFNLSMMLNQGNGWVFDIGLKDYSIVNYDIKYPGSAYGEDYTQYYSGNGGLERITLGFSYILFKDFSYGLQFNYIFGNIDKVTDIEFSNTNLANTKNEITNSLSGYYFNTGLVFHGFDKVFKSKKMQNMTLGLFFSTPMSLNSSLTGKFYNSIGIDSTGLNSGKIKIPWSGGIGISNEFANSLLVSADVLFQKWADYKFYDVHPPEIRNSLRVGAGLEYTPSKKLDAPFYKKMSYRAGASYTQDYLKINGQPINAIGVNAGFSIPLSRFNNADLLFSYSTRGKTSDGLIKDDVLKFAVSVNIGELWFLRPKGE